MWLTCSVDASNCRDGGYYLQMLEVHVVKCPESVSPVGRSGVTVLES